MQIVDERASALCGREKFLCETSTPVFLYSLAFLSLS